MSCYHPLIMIDTNDMSDPNQRAILEKIKWNHRHDTRIRNCQTLIIPREVAEREGLTLKANSAKLIPCGQCIGCRLDYSRQWAERCIHEASQHKYNYFLTLTYDDLHMLYGLKGNPTLVKKELSAFIKRFREKMRINYGVDGIKFFACGEYGSPNHGERIFNPHFHIILFDCPLPDLQERHPIEVDGQIKWLKQYDDDGNQLLYSPLIAECWRHQGTAQIGQVSYESCAYVARYCCKKAGNPDLQQKGEGAKIYSELGIQPEFVNMSRRPGIGASWYEEHLEHIYMYDNISFKRGEVVVNQTPNRYCDKLLKKKDIQKFYDIKKKRSERFYDNIELTDFNGHDVAEQNHKKEVVKRSQIKTLHRDL